MNIKEKTLTDVPFFEEQEIIIKKLNFGEKSELTSSSLTIKVDRHGREDIAIDPAKMRLNTVAIGIKSAPFMSEGLTIDKRVEVVKKLESETGEHLYIEIQKLNKPAVEEDLKKKSSKELEDTKSAPLKQTN